MPTATVWSFSPARTAAAADQRVAATTLHPSVAAVLEAAQRAATTMPAEDRPAELARLLGLQRHPEGGRYGEFFRSPHFVATDDGRGLRNAFTCIDFVLAAGEHSAWHREQAAEPQGDHAYIGATVGPGFEFTYFAFGRDDATLRGTLRTLRPDLLHLLD
jgi:predicted cupin superfamily sugar epimerase